MDTLVDELLDYVLVRRYSICFLLIRSLTSSVITAPLSDQGRFSALLIILNRLLHDYDWRLIVLAGSICALASFTSVTLIARLDSARSRNIGIWLVSAAFVFGCGIWSLHFVAMLAFMPGMPVAYGIGMTVVSIGVAIGGSFLAFSVWRFATSPFVRKFIAGLLLCAAVAGMHYSGVAAMRFQGRLVVDKQQIALSLLIGSLFSCAAFARSRKSMSLWRRLEVASFLALCVCSVHFLGMTALTMVYIGPIGPSGAILPSNSLAIAVGCVSMTILTASSAATLAEQYLTQRSLLELKRMRLLSDLCKEVIIIHRDELILEVNAAGGRLFGVSTDRLIGSRLLDFFIAGDRPLLAQRITCQTAIRKPEEVRVNHVSGTTIPVELSCRVIEFEGRSAVALALSDLSERKRDEERIRYLAHHDFLTDLPNRFLLQERLTHVLDAAARTGTGVALLYLDLDRFKSVNDSFGHSVGDDLLIQVGHRLRAEIRASDTLARIGGDEFVLVTDIEQAENAALISYRLIETLSKPFDIGGRRIEIGTSIGISLYPRDGATPQSLLDAADTALYRAKEERNIYCFFSIEMDDGLRARRQLDQDLRRALERNELLLQYQPVVSCLTGAVEGFEALLRWEHPQRGSIPPMSFIPLAEENGLIVKIGQWVLETACTAAMTWSQPRWIAVNVSPKQFRQGDLYQTVSSILIKTGMPADRLEIEVTENVFIDDSKRAIDILSNLRRLGVRIALDDFGTGYSSLSYLRSFSFDKLKIDRSFIKGLGHSADAMMIVHTIIGLGHNLGLSIVAEGVETTQQLALIREQMCDQVQGYLLGGPMSMDCFNDSVAERACKLILANLATASSFC